MNTTQTVSRLTGGMTRDELRAVICDLANYIEGVSNAKEVERLLSLSACLAMDMNVIPADCFDRFQEECQ